jgi:integrase
VIKALRKYAGIVRERTRHGKEIYFYRPVHHGPRIRIHETPGTDEFERRYDELVRQRAAGAFKRKPSRTATPGTLRWLGAQYMASTHFQGLDEVNTQYPTRRVLQSIFQEPLRPGAKEVFGDCPLSEFGPEHVGVLRDRKTPGAANNRLKKLKAMFKWALQPEQKRLGVTTNPVRDVAKLKSKRKGGFPVWKPEDLDKFEAHHPIGSKARLALALLMFTGARRSDVVCLGPPMVRNGWITWLPHKGRNREEPMEVSLPIIADLKAVIDATPVVGTATYLVTQYGKAFSPEGFGNKMKDWCREAGIADKNSHGVRKAAAKRMADRGASTHALMAWFGWLDIKQAELYTRDASRRRLAGDNAHLVGTNEDQFARTLGGQGIGAGGKSE